MIKRISVILEFPISMREIRARLGMFLSLAECDTLLTLCVPAVADFLDPVTHGIGNYTRASEYLEDRGMSPDMTLKMLSEIEQIIIYEILSAFREVGQPNLYYERTEHVGGDAFAIFFKAHEV